MDRFTPWLSGLSDAHAIHTAWVRNPFMAFLVIFLLIFFFFDFINKNNQCNVCKYKYYLTTHTYMSEVEVYSVNKLTFWAMDKNVVGKKNSRPGRDMKKTIGVRGKKIDATEGTWERYIWVRKKNWRPEGTWKQNIWVRKRKKLTPQKGHKKNIYFYIFSPPPFFSFYFPTFFFSTFFFSHFFFVGPFFPRFFFLQFFFLQMFFSPPFFFGIFFWFIFFPSTFLGRLNPGCNS